MPVRRPFDRRMVGVFDGLALQLLSSFFLLTQQTVQILQFFLGSEVPGLGGLSNLRGDAFGFFLEASLRVFDLGTQDLHTRPSVTEPPRFFSQVAFHRSEESYSVDETDWTSKYTNLLGQLRFRYLATPAGGA